MTLDIIIPIYNKEKNILNIYNKINDELKNIKHKFIFIDDYSNDKSLEILKNIYSNDEENVKIISLSKTHGKDTSIYVGLKNSKHELVCIYDMELQANVSHISKMTEFIINNSQYDQVCMYSNLQLKGFEKIKNNSINKILDLDFDINKTYYRVMKRNVVDAVIQMSNNYRFSKYIFELIGFNTYYLKFECRNNITNISFKKLYSYSNNPLNIIKYISYLLLSITFALLVISILNIFTVSNNVILLFLFLFNTTILFLTSIICNCKNKDNKTCYLIREKIGFDENYL